ncbi:thioesterase family protein [Faucicola mancuniensis]|uniref:thioesterase family protein n=1 Tax=Faucicola mancuniensis TaxID=1309795 RepID=UPI00397789FF
MPNKTPTTAILDVDFIEEKDEHSDLTNEQELVNIRNPILQNQNDNPLNFSENLHEVGHQLAEIMSHSPFLKLTNTVFNFDNTTEQITGKTVSTPDLIGNVNYQILHGGVSATVLDTLGGVIAMYEIFKRGQGTFDELTKKVMKVATVDLRIDYLAVGRGAFYTSTGEIIRMGRKGCTVRMMLADDTGKPIAHGIASYAF